MAHLPICVLQGEICGFDEGVILCLVCERKDSIDFMKGSQKCDRGSRIGLEGKG